MHNVEKWAIIICKSCDMKTWSFYFVSNAPLEKFIIKFILEETGLLNTVLITHGPQCFKRFPFNLNLGISNVFYGEPWN